VIRAALGWGLSWRRITLCVLYKVGRLHQLSSFGSLGVVQYRPSFSVAMGCSNPRRKMSYTSQHLVLPPCPEFLCRTVGSHLIFLRWAKLHKRMRLLNTGVSRSSQPLCLLLEAIFLHILYLHTVRISNTKTINSSNNHKQNGVSNVILW